MVTMTRIGLRMIQRFSDLKLHTSRRTRPGIKKHREQKKFIISSRHSTRTNEFFRYDKFREKRSRRFNGETYVGV